MKKLLLILTILCSLAASGQRLHPQYSFVGVNIEEWGAPIPFYTTINSRYFWLAGAFSALNIPAGGTAVRQSNQWNRSGMLFYDSTGADTGLYVSHGTNWVKVGSSSTPGLQDVLTQNSTLTGDNTIDGGGGANILTFTNNAQFQAVAIGGTAYSMLNLTPSTGKLVAEQSSHTSSFVANKDSLSLWPFTGKLHIDTLVKGSIDTTTYKPMAWSSVRGDVVAMNSWAQVSGGGSTPTLQQVLTAGSTVNTGMGITTSGTFTIGDNSGASTISLSVNAGDHLIELGNGTLILKTGGGTGNQIDFNNAGLVNIKAKDSLVFDQAGGYYRFKTLLSTIDTTTYKPFVVDINGKVRRGNSWSQFSGGGGSGLTVGTTAIASGTASRVLFEGAGNVLQESGNLTFTGTALNVLGVVTQGGTAGMAGYMKTNVTNLASTTDLNPGLLLYGDGVGTAPYGMDVGYNGTTSRYRNRMFFYGTAADFAFSAVGTVSPTGQSDFTDLMVLRGDNGNLGIGVLAPTAALHLKAGTTSANTASLKITEGARNTTAEDGAIEKDDAFYMTKTNAVRYGVGGSLKSVFATVGNVGAGEDDLQTVPIPAGALSQDGDYIEFTMAFSIAGNGTLKVYFGAQQLFSFSALASDAVYRVTGQVVRTGAATQRATFELKGGATVSVVGYQLPTETLSGAVTLKATYEGTSNNDGTQTLTTVKYFPAN